MPRPETHSRKLERELRTRPTKQITVAEARELLGAEADIGKAVRGLERKGALWLEADGPWTDPETTITLMGHKGRRTPAVPDPEPKPPEPPAPLGPTFLRMTVDYTGERPEWSEAEEVHRSGTTDAPNAPAELAIVVGEDFVQRMREERERRERISTGHELMPEVQAELDANPGATLFLVCADCSTRRPKPGECPNCSATTISTVGVKLPEPMKAAA